MNDFWKAAVVLSAVLVAANSLTCRQCVIGVFDTCLFPTDVTCNNATENCYRGNAQFNATGSLTLHTRGCLDTDLCGVTLTGSLLGAAYTSSFTCCNTTLCNGAAAAPASVVTALCAAALSALWGFREL